MRKLPSPLTIVVVVVALLLVGVLASVTATVNNRNETRLLQEQVDQAGIVVSELLPSLETPLETGAAIAAVTGDQIAQFDQFMSPAVGTDGPFGYVALCGEQVGVPQVIGSLGTPGSTTGPGSEQCDFLKGAHAPGISVEGIVGHGSRVAMTYLSPTPGLGVYAEYLLPAHRRISLQGSPSFANLNFALYLGPSHDQQHLLEATTNQLPITGRVATTKISFANVDLTLVGTSTQPLGGSLSRRVTPFVIIVGVMLAFAAGFMTERLIRRRRSAEDLADENQRLYSEQQGVAASLQRALLPGVIPEIPGVEIATRYEAGLDVLEIGGDWFDIIVHPDGGFVFVVGDVSGRGVQAAIVMASLHYAIRAYVAQGDPPGQILTKLSGLLDVVRDGHFATILCGYVDAAGTEGAVSSAGHLPPLLVDREQGSFLTVTVGPPIGSVSSGTYPATTFQIPDGCTLVAYTDGLVERRGRSLDVGLDDLRRSVVGSSRSLETILSDLVADLTPEGSDDDIAILGIRWTRQ
jgi:Stage II sporulation protein E (SpoIIE)